MFLIFLPFPSMLFILYLPCGGGWNSEPYLSAAVTWYCGFIGPLWISKKLRSMKHEFIKLRHIIEVNVHISPKATKSRFQPSKRKLYNHFSWWKSIAKKLLFFIFSTTGKLFHYIRQKWICWVSQNTNRYRRLSLNDNFATIGPYAFSKHYIQFRIWKYTCIMYASWPFYHHVKKTVVVICCCLNI